MCFADKDRWFAIVNPVAGNHKGERDLPLIQSALEGYGLRCEYKLTKQKGDATLLTKRAAEEGYRKFIAVGGDGTLNEIVNGIMIQNSSPTTDFTVGSIPIGTGNDWGRMFGIPYNDYTSAAQIISCGEDFLHDVGIVEYGVGDVRQKRYFINIAGTGFEAIVIKKTNEQKERSHLKGKLVYIYNLLKNFLLFESPLMAIDIDDKHFETEVFSVNIGNGRYCGGGMSQTPRAIPNDGLLDITVIKNMSRWKFAMSVKRLYDGTILNHPLVEGFMAKKIAIDSHSSIYVEADGESFGNAPLVFSVAPSAINTKIRSVLV